MSVFMNEESPGVIREETVRAGLLVFRFFPVMFLVVIVVAILRRTAAANMIVVTGIAGIGAWFLLELWLRKQLRIAREKRRDG
ncbi:hypothetical protein NA78x_002380 [Anatilimnocola sp. NA78]|uniref:hypothetical protein n=1 Tax=Anatilimnocola sp. NA78 TaxID=3415683 RepID=UPI003CE4F81C